ncbi:hypothetical protein BD311DRAFT_750568 [Dichomitus squalens]|uniref:Transmembrane protein n=1 Tax=Dichomitus squalens TaxID=114155 RepID=A0A4Q9MXA8_9APHY|nr:hypothetical protein BD311DRAFT_750568 [Dichomitus squalens]
MNERGACVGVTVNSLCSRPTSSQTSSLTTSEYAVWTACVGCKALLYPVFACLCVAFQNVRHGKRPSLSRSRAENLDMQLRKGLRARTETDRVRLSVLRLCINRLARRHSTALLALALSSFHHPSPTGLAQAFGFVPNVTLFPPSLFALGLLTQSLAVAVIN